jgi:ornithine cyclodeaminase/alanine dehydrogenase-like protein (mu-crystallin family)
VLTRSDVARLLDLGACIAAVERAFGLLGDGRVPPPLMAGAHAADGGFHLKAGLFDGGRPVFAVKANANFPANPARHGLPTVQGVIVLFDATQGRLLAVLDSIEVTTLRTGAATAVAARLLARPDAAVVGIVGCGVQGRVQLRALARVRRLARAVAYDAVPATAVSFATELSRELGIPVAAAGTVREATAEADMVVTCTPAREFLVGPDDVRPGTFVAGVGADAEHKRELEPALLARATVVVDLLDQCAAFGDLHHALAAGVCRRGDVHAELGAIVAGRAPGRTRPDEITVFDSTGMALQDAAAAVEVYERALAAGAGLAVPLGAAPTDRC